MVLPERIFSEIGSTSKFSVKKIINVIGGGPAGLMAAEAAAQRGHHVTVYDSMPSVGRKFLMAGRGGLNITHSEAPELFRTRYGNQPTPIGSFIDVFGPQHVTKWCNDLGVETFVGTSGRVFPKDFKAAPLLRAWIRRLRLLGVTFKMRYRWNSVDADRKFCFTTPDGPVSSAPDAAILSMGGGSWPQLGSDGQWFATLNDWGLNCAPLTPSNCGFDFDWSAHLTDRFAGIPLKSVVLMLEGQSAKGDLMITATGLEGGPIYALSAILRDRIAADGPAAVLLDLCPDKSLDRLSRDLAAPRGSRSLSSHLKRCTGLPAPALALLHESVGPHLPQSPAQLAALIKALPLIAKRPRPLAEAISSAGGVCWSEVDQTLQLKRFPGIFVAGEMLDWEAPTGGYLLTGCLSTGFAAGNGAATYVENKTPGS